MPTIARLSIEPPSSSGMLNRMQSSSATPTNPPSESTREEPPFSHLWKGICDFFTGIFKPEQTSLARKAKSLEEENMALRARLDEREKSVKMLERLYEQQLKLGAQEIGEALTSQAEMLQTTRTGEVQRISSLFVRHEAVVVESFRYKQGYEQYKRAYDTLAEKYNALHERMGLLEQEMEELEEETIDLEVRYFMERDKVAAHERFLRTIGIEMSSN